MHVKSVSAYVSPVWRRAAARATHCACAAAQAARSSTLAAVGTPQEGRVSDVNEKIIRNRRLHFAAAQRRHLRARLHGILGAAEAPARYEEDNAAQRSGSLSPVVVVTRRVSNSGRERYATHIRVRVRDRCCVCTESCLGNSVDESEERATVAALRLFPSAQAWDHFCEAVDSRVFSDALRLASVASTGDIEVHLAAQNGESIPPVCNRHHGRRSGSAQVVATVIVVGDGASAGTTLESNDDDIASPVAVARESAQQPRDALKLALAASVERLDDLISEKWQSVLADAKALVVEKAEANSLSPLGSGMALKNYLSVTPRIFGLRQAGDPRSFPKVTLRVKPESRHGGHTLVSGNLATPGSNDGVRLDVGTAVLPPLARQHAYRTRYLNDGRTLVVGRSTERALRGGTVVAQCLGAIALARDGSCKGCAPPFTLDDCLRQLMTSRIASVCRPVLESPPGKRAPFHFSSDFFTTFAREMKTLRQGHEGDSRGDRGARTLRLLTAVTPHLVRRSPSALSIASSTPLNLLQEGFFTVAYAAITASAERGELAFDDTTTQSSAGFSTRRRSTTRTLERLVSAAAWSLLGDATPTPDTLSASAWLAFDQSLDTKAAEAERFTQQCFQRDGTLKWAITEHGQPGAAGKLDPVHIVTERRLVLSWPGGPRGGSSGSFLSELARRGRTGGGGDTTATENTLVLGSLLTRRPHRHHATPSHRDASMGGVPAEQRLSLLKEVGLPREDHPVVSQFHPSWIRTPRQQGRLSCFGLLRARGLRDTKMVARNHRRQDEIHVPDIPLMIYAMREALRLPPSSFPSIQFTQEARHEPARRMRQLKSGRPGDVDFLTRVVVKWAAPGHATAGRQGHLVAVAESDPDAHSLDADGMPISSRCTDAATILYSLRDMGEPRGPLVLLISAICELYRVVMGRDSTAPFPLINVREVAPGRMGDGDDPALGRRTIDFLLYSWFGASPQIRCYDIMTHGADRGSGGSFGRQAAALPQKEGAASAATHMVRAMLLYDILGQRVLFAETHDTTVAAATARVEQLAYQLNVPRVGFDATATGPTVPDAGVAGVYASAVAAPSAVASRPFRSLAAGARHRSRQAALERLVAEALSRQEEGDEWSGLQRVHRAASRLLREVQSELAASIALMEAALAVLAEKASKARTATAGEERQVRFCLVFRYEPAGGRAAAEAELSALQEGRGADVWWGQCVAGLVIPPSRGILEVRLVSTAAPCSPYTESTTVAGTESSHRAMIGGGAATSKGGGDGFVPTLTKLCFGVTADLLRRLGMPHAAARGFLEACEGAAPLLQQSVGGFPPYDARFYYPPQLLGMLLQGVAGKYACHYERCFCDLADTRTSPEDDSSGRADVDSANVQTVFYKSSSFDPRRLRRGGGEGGGKEEGGRREEGKSRPRNPPVSVSAVKCVISIATVSGYRNGESAQEADATPRPTVSFPLGVGFGRTKREAWLSAAWHALRHNYPDIVAQIGPLKGVSELQRNPQALLALAGHMPKDGATPPIPSLAWSCRRRKGERAGEGFFECAAQLASSQGSLPILLAVGRSVTPGVAYAQAAETLLSLARERMGASGIPHFALWDSRTNYYKSVWHAICGAITAAQDGCSTGGRAQVLFMEERGGSTGQSRASSSSASALPLSPGVAMVLSVRTFRAADGVWVSGTIARASWEELLVAGSAAATATTGKGARLAEMLRSADASMLGTVFLLGVTRTLLSSFDQVASDQHRSRVANELRALLPFLARETVEDAAGPTNDDAKGRRALRQGKWHKATLLQRCTSGVEAVTGLQVQTVTWLNTDEGDVWRAELLVQLPLFEGAGERNATGDGIVRRRRLPLTVFSGSGPTKLDAESEMGRAVCQFLRSCLGVVGSKR